MRAAEVSASRTFKFCNFAIDNNTSFKALRALLSSTTWA